MDAVDTLREGSVVGRHVLTRVLGKGHFSHVWESAEHMAVKVQRAEYWEEGWDEAKLWSMLGTHPPNALPLLEHFVADAGGAVLPKCKNKHQKPERPANHVFVSSVGGKSMLHWQELFRRGHQTPTPRLAAHVARELLHALEFMRTRRLVHTDMKPENVLFNTNATSVEELLDGASLTVVVVDFGNACDEWEPASDKIQTREYQSPEAIVCAPYSFSADMWSLGVILYEFVTGNYMFDVYEAVRDGAEGYDSAEEEEYVFEEGEVEESISCSEAGRATPDSTSSVNSELLNFEHLAQIHAVCGRPLPRGLMRGGLDSKTYYTRKRLLRRGDEYKDRTVYDDMVRHYNIQDAYAMTMHELLTPMLHIVPQSRCTPRQALDNPALERLAALQPPPPA